ncbi:DUF1761 domain-containing protein [Sphingomonas sp.]|uniref:DUF1761 domain-containing protein n=1 Tax=Sphingomonas sp. TaxID=28214 RepID=UPI001B17B9E1|nr:DUF1761 domain-containing protein [Sphingomonas sp.]MBO9712235.1 DUF1761 domain-containing protein [Sphingomonas sp.]
MQIHWLAVLVASVAGFLVGGLWYGPIFGKAWMKERGFTPESAKQGANLPLTFGLTFLLNLFSALALDHLFNSYDAPMDFHHSMIIVALVAIGFVIPAFGVNYLFSRMSRALFLIDAGYWLAIYLTIGAVFGVLR